jgi:predicted HTH transcriptional regulator
LSGVTDDEFAALIQLGAEQRNIEYKGPGPISDKHLINKVTRAILGMTNRRDGGFVVVGVNEFNGALDPIGIQSSEIVSWTRDDLADKVAPLVDPSVHFDLEHRTYSGRQFVIMIVREFDETPVFCRVNKNGAKNDVVLREGALYVRGRRKPETVEIRTAQEMRDLLELSLQKRLRNFTALAQAAGLSLSPVPTQSDRDQFSNQLAELGL